MNETQTKMSRLIFENEEIFDCAFSKIFPTNEQLQEAETRFHFKIPKEYVWFL